MRTLLLRGAAVALAVSSCQAPREALPASQVRQMGNDEYERAQLAALGCISGASAATSGSRAVRRAPDSRTVNSLPRMQGPSDWRVPLSPLLPPTAAAAASAPSPAQTAPPPGAQTVQKMGSAYFSPGGGTSQKIGSMMFNSDGTSGTLIGNKVMGR